MTDYETPDLELHLEAPDLTRFTIEHWLYLHLHAGVSPPPTELAPFPLMVHSDEQLRRNLDQWELVDDVGRPVAELVEMIERLTVYDTAVWGHVRFPLRAHTRTYDIPSGAEEWGMEGERLIVPRVPFLITRSEKGLTIATSSQDELLVAPAPLTDEVDDFADALWAVLDPERKWTPLAIPQVRVPREMVDELAEDESVSSLAATPERQHLVERMVAAAEEHGVTNDTAVRLAEVVAAQPAAMCQFLTTITDSAGIKRTPKSSAGSVIFTAGDEPTVFITHPERDYAGYPSVVYRSGDDDGMTGAVSAMLTEARNPRWEAADGTRVE